MYSSALTEVPAPQRRPARAVFGHAAWGADSVNRPAALAALNRRLLEAYSRRVIGTLRASLPFGGAVDHFAPLLAHNVEKEVRKDALVIRRAAAETDSRVDAAVLHELLEAGKAIDRTFLSDAERFPLRIVIAYEQITPIRIDRVERLFGATRRVLDAWGDARGLRAALRASHPQAELEHLLGNLLSLYAEETRLLSRSVQLPLVLRPLRERIAAGLQHTMNEVAARLAAQIASGVHRNRPV